MASTSTRSTFPGHERAAIFASRRVQRRQELFDHLQWRTGIGYYALTLGELAAAGIKRAMPVCRDYACLHRPNEPIALSGWPAKMATRTLRKKLVCSKCGLRRLLVFEGD